MQSYLHFVMAMLLSLCEEFGVAITLYDAQGNVITHCGGGADICRSMRQNVTLLRECQKCDRCARMRLLAGCKRLIYLCHAGILEAAVPIRRRNGDLVGYFIMGKCLTADRAEEHKKAYRKLYVCPDPDRSNLASLPDLPRLGTGELQRAIHSLERIARNIERAGSMEGFRDPVILQIIRMVETGRVGMSEREKVTCERIYGVLPFSRRSLEEKVMECCGEKLSEFLYQRTMIRAEDLLLNTRHKVDEIAGLLGYDPAGFSEFFKHHYGDTPGNFRSFGVDRKARFENALAARTRFGIPF